jgi:3-hydroxybutyrate dehydrogenase
MVTRHDDAPATDDLTRLTRGHVTVVRPEDAPVAAQARARGIPAQSVVDAVMLRPMPKHAFVTIEDPGGIAEFLASDVARDNAGQSITVDGGWTSQ